MAGAILAASQATTASEVKSYLIIEITDINYTCRQSFKLPLLVKK